MRKIKTKAGIKARTKKRRARFVIGYIGAGNLVYGRSRQYGNLAKRRPSIRTPSEDEPTIQTSYPMSRLHAEKLLDEMPCADCAIFELVPVKVNR